LLLLLQEECVRVLLFRGADHTIQNYANQTAAEVAIIANNKQVAKLIREFSPSNVGRFKMQSRCSA
jgi:hypothetical protein